MIKHVRYNAVMVDAFHVHHFEVTVLELLWNHSPEKANGLWGQRLLSKCISIVQFSNKSLMARADSGPQDNLRFGSAQLAEKAWTCWHWPYLEIWTHLTSHFYSVRMSLKYGGEKKEKKLGKQEGEGVQLTHFPLFLYLNSWKPGNSPRFASSTIFYFFF